MAKRSVVSSSVAPPTPERKRGGNPGFEDVDRLENSDHVVAIISQRRTSGVLTVGFWREYDRDGVMEKTQFFPESLLPSLLRMVQLAADRVAELKRDPSKLPFPLPAPR